MSMSEQIGPELFEELADHYLKLADQYPGLLSPHQGDVRQFAARVRELGSQVATSPIPPLPPRDPGAPRERTVVPDQRPTYRGDHRVRVAATYPTTIGEECGTLMGFCRHLRDDEFPCDDCIHARSRHTRAVDEFETPAELRRGLQQGALLRADSLPPFGEASSAICPRINDCCIWCVCDHWCVVCRGLWKFYEGTNLWVRENAVRLFLDVARAEEQATAEKREAEHVIPPDARVVVMPTLDEIQHLIDGQ